MDNQNDPNSSNNQNNASPFGAPAQPPSDLNNFPSSTPTSPEAIPTPPAPAAPTPIPSWASPSQQTTPAPASTPSDIWSVPPNPEPAASPSSTPSVPAPDQFQPEPANQQPLETTPFPPASDNEPNGTLGNSNSPWNPPSQPSTTPTTLPEWESTPNSEPTPAQTEPLIPSSNIAQNPPQTNTELTDSPSAGSAPLPDQPSATNTLDQSSPQVPNPVAANLDPTPTFMSAATPPSDTKPTESNPNLSALDNPWAAPVKPPAFDGSPQSVQPSWNNTPSNSPESQTADTPQSAPKESVPTDLSHLITNNPQSESAKSAPETLVVPSAATPNPETPNLPTESHKGGIPKWLIGLGAGLLVLVAGVSAYFILGIGQPPKTASIPAITAPKTSEIKPPLPVATPANPAAQPPVQSAPATGSANFGELQGGNNGTQATSAADLIRQRQGI